MEHVDVVVIGAGISGIGMAAHLAMKRPEKKVVILEARESLGGTWDLFRYPGIRSDSDMVTFGYGWKPWIDDRTLADGPSILAYLREAAHEQGLEPKIRYRHRVRRASWSTETARWTLDLEVDGAPSRISCDFLLGGTGYYDYARGHRPRFEDEERFAGTFVHPQEWPADLDYAGKRVVVIGSGATAVTLVPELSKKAAHVTMLQRSPTYIARVPSRDRISRALHRALPTSAAFALSRAKNIGFGLFFYELCRRQPERMKRWLVGQVEKELGPDHDVATHFTPRYAPWDQRLCAVPDGDLFAAIRGGRASVVTDRIERFTEKGILLGSGRQLEADIVVTATGLEVLFLGGIELRVDGALVQPKDKLLYKTMMLEDVPNFVFSFGYTNATWTLKVDLVGEYVCRLLAQMDARGVRRCTPRRRPGVREVPFLDFSSGYVQRALPSLPKQGDAQPWRLAMNYLVDAVLIRFGTIDDGTLELATEPPARPAAARPSPAAN